MGTSERRQRERERKRREIAQAARDLFLEKGYASTTVDDIARRLELSKGAIYLQFGSKDEIYYAVAREAMSVLHGEFAKAASGAGNGRQRFLAIGTAYADFWTGHPDYRTLLHDGAGRAPPSASGPNGEGFAEVAAEVNGLMAKVLREGVEDGSIRGDLSPEIAAFCASSAMDGILSRLERRAATGAGGAISRDDALAFAFGVFDRAFASGDGDRSKAGVRSRR